MSLRPGLGGTALWEVADVVLQWDGDQAEADVPTQLRHGPRLLPLGRYLTRRLRKLTGRDEKAPQSVLDQVAAEMLDVRMATEEITAKNRSLKRYVMKDLLILKNRGRTTNMVGKHKAYSKRRAL